MRRQGVCARLLLLVGGGTLVLAGLPAAAAPSAAGGTAAASEVDALDLLGDAAVAARTRAWSGTQYVASWRDGDSSSAVVEVAHDPGRGTRVQAEDGTVVVPPTALSAPLLGQLADRYALAVTGDSTCSGRPVHVVEATRADGQVAARFWLDRETGLPLRRELWDADGRRLRSSAFVDVEVGPGAPAREAVRTVSSVLPPDVPADLPADLPGGFTLFSVERPVHDGQPVLHLTWSDGLSTVSVFSQPGSAGSAPADGYREVEVDGAPVWLREGTPQRLVWGGGGRVFTLLSDAGGPDLLAVVRALPHDRAPDDGLLPRLGRGLARVGSWVDPLD